MINQLPNFEMKLDERVQSAVQCSELCSYYWDTKNKILNTSMNIIQTQVRNHIETATSKSIKPFTPYNLL